MKKPVHFASILLLAGALALWAARQAVPAEAARGPVAEQGQVRGTAF